jgi:hypothetical protein
MRFQLINLHVLDWLVCFTKSLITIFLCNPSFIDSIPLPHSKAKTKITLAMIHNYDVCVWDLVVKPIINCQHTKLL